MIKRLLPFMLTLTIGLVLGNWLSPNSRYAYRSFRAANKCRGAYVYEPARTPAPSSDRTWAIIKFQPEVDYTETARRKHVTGSVRLRVLLDANGTVSKVVSLETLTDGLTEAAIDSAWKTTFIPATKDGRPVSVWVEIDHEFTGDGVLSYTNQDVYDVIAAPENQQESFEIREMSKQRGVR